MNFTVIICTFMRPKPILNLLKSIKEQKVYPNEILIIDGSLNEETKKVVETTPSSEPKEEEKGLWTIFFLAFLNLLISCK